MNQLLTALEAAAQRHGAPVIGSHAGRAGYFPALIFGDDHKFVPGGDRTVIYEFTGNGQPAIPHNWRDIGTRDNELDAMSAHAETYLAERAAPVRDQWNAEWLDGLARADAQQDERAQRTAVLRVMQDATAIGDMRAERSAQRVGGL